MIGLLYRRSCSGKNRQAEEMIMRRIGRKNIVVLIACVVLLQPISLSNGADREIVSVKKARAASFSNYIEV